MIKKIILMLMFVMLVHPCNAVTWDAYTDLAGIGNYIQPDSYTGSNTENLFIFSNGTDIYVADNTLYGATKIINNVQAEVSDIVADKNYIYIVFYNGATFRVPNSPYLKDWDDYSIENRVYLGDFSELDTANDHLLRIVVDSYGDIYVSDSASETIYKIDGDLLTSSIYLSDIDTDTGGIISMYAGTHFYVAVSRYGSDEYIDIYTVDSINGEELLFSVNGGPDEARIGGLSELTNGNLLLSYIQVDSDAGDSNNFISEYYINGTLLGNVYTSTDYTVDKSLAGDITVLENGIIIFVNDLSSEIITFSTISGAGGYLPAAPGNTETSYQSASIISDYNTYVNNSDIYTRYNIATSILTDTEQTTFKQTYDFRVELISPNGTMLSYKTIDGNTFNNIKFESPTVFPTITTWIVDKLTSWAIGDQFLIKTGALTFSSSNDWKNGTYTLKLYEVNTFSGTRNLMDVDTFIILNEGYESSYDVETNTDEQSSTQNVYDFIFSKYFIGIIGFVAIVKAIGTDKLGRINGTMAVIGVVVADIVLVLTGIFPVWTIFVLVLFGLILLGKRNIEGGDS